MISAQDGGAEVQFRSVLVLSLVPLVLCSSTAAPEAQRSPMQVPARAAVRPAVSPRPGDLAGAADNPLARVTYMLVSDSNGGRPNPGVQVILLFSAASQMYVYAASATEALADPGTYSYTPGRLTIDINTLDIKVDTTVAFDIRAGEVTLPFQVFTTAKGTSLWKQVPLALDEGIFGVFDAANEVAGETITPEQAAAQAYSFALDWVGAGASDAASTVAGQADGPRASSANRAQATAVPQDAADQTTGACAPGGTNCITGVQSVQFNGDEIQVNYLNSPPLIVSLYSSPPVALPEALTWSPLHDDPRVRLGPTVHPDSQFNPPHKTAVFIAPFPNAYFQPWSSRSLTPNGEISEIAGILSSRGYDVDKVVGSDATVEGIVVAVVKDDPGFLWVSTHGNSFGGLETGETVTLKGGGWEAVDEAYTYEEARLEKEGLSSLVAFDRVTIKGHSVPSTFSIVEQQCSYLAITVGIERPCTAYVDVAANFWLWLRVDLHVNFAGSLVYIAACLTDTTPLLRIAFHARAYFAFSEVTNGGLANAVALYLAKSLARPTHSAEEAYYNMLRIEKTGLMIYDEDGVFEGVLYAPESAKTGSFGLAGNLDGWGWNGQTLVSYQSAGWLSGQVDPGQVWWMLYAARWISNTKQAAAALLSCYDKYWIKGSPGGLASEYCNAANAGVGGNKERLLLDVEYAIYLLDGNAQGLPEDLVVPRWTLDD